MNKLFFTIITIAVFGLTQLGFSQTINVTRKMPNSTTPGGEFTVELTVEKGTTSGFAKLQEELPEGFVATAGETKSATFTFDKNKVKLIWMSLPADAKFIVSYKVKVDVTLAGTKSVSGTFSYIEGNDTKKLPIAFSSIDISSSAPASSPVETKAAETPVVEQKQPKNVAPPVIEKKEPEKIVPPAEEKKQPEKVMPPVIEKTPEPIPAPPAAEPKKIEKPIIKPVVSAPKVISGIVFRVQIAAGQNGGTESYFKNKYGISDEIYSEQIEGLYKYTVGSFSNYDAAKDYRDKMRSAGVEGAFIVAYQNGARISLQDALKSSGQ